MSNNKKKNIEISFYKNRFKEYINTNNTNNTMIKLDLEEIINDILVYRIIYCISKIK